VAVRPADTDKCRVLPSFVNWLRHVVGIAPQ
jgi:hypothetical protein